MTSQLTDKTHVVVTKLGDFWVTASQGEKIMNIKQTDPSGMIRIEGNMLACHSLDGVITAQTYDELNAKRRGAWRCKHTHWHERGQTCAHGQLR